MGGEAGMTVGRVEDEKERLSHEDVLAGDLLAVTHLHRYELAARLGAGAGRVLDLCCGVGYGSRVLAANAASVHGVDVSEAAIAAAREAVGPDTAGRIEFTCADAHAFLRAQPRGAFDVIVCFEGIEHVPDPGAVADELLRLVEGGARVVLSLPNSKAFDEHNEFHVTDFGWEEARALIDRFEGAFVLEQHLTEGSVIAPSGEPPEQGAARLFGREGRDGTAWASHWIALVGFDDAAAAVADARLSFATAHPHYSYMRDLELANAELMRMNARLGRGWLGVHDASSASVLRHLEDQTAEAKKWKAIADNNDFARQGLQRRLDSPGHRMVERVRGAASRVPGVQAAAKLRRRLGS